MQTVLTWAAGISLFLAAALSGALGSGDRIRANYQTERREDRTMRFRLAALFLVVGIISGLLAWALP